MWARTAAAVLVLAVTMGLAAATLVAAAPRAGAATLGDYATRLEITLSGIDPIVVTSTSANTVTITGRYTNTGPDTIDELDYRFQRGDRLRGAQAVREEVADPVQPVAVVNADFHPLTSGVAAGASASFSATVPVTGDPADTLAVTRPGVYPVMLNVNGTVHAAGGSTEARVGELHFLLTVTALPGSTPPGGTTGPRAEVGMLWPLTDTPHLGVDGVFLDDDLAAEVAPGGRLASTVNLLTSTEVDPNFVTLAIDPMLLDELDRMSHGYWVVAHPGTPQPRLRPRTPTPTPTSGAPPPSSPRTPVHTGATPGPGGDSGAVAPTPTGAAADTPAGDTPAGDTPAGDTPAGDTETGNTAAGSAAPPAGDLGTAEPPSGVATPPTPATGSTTSTPSSPAPPTGTTTPPPARPGHGTPSYRPPGTVAGRGSADAAALLDRLRTFAQTHRVLVLPYGDPDVVALVRAGMSTTLAAAVYRGRAVASRVLGDPSSGPGAAANLVEDVAAPPGGVMTAAAWRALRSLGYRSAILAPDGVASATSGVAVVTVGEDTFPAAVSDAGLAAELTSILHTGRPQDWVSEVNVLAALLTVGDSDGAATALVVAPPRPFSAAPGGLAAAEELLAGLTSAGYVTATPVTEIARTAGGMGGDDGLDGSDGPGRPGGIPPGSAAAAVPHVHLTYSATAEHAELPPQYLEGVRSLKAQIDVLARALGPAENGPRPAALLDPLSDSLLTAVSCAFRGQADPDRAVLTTVRTTLDWLYRGVRIARDNGSYTLASSTAPLLLTVQNTLPYQVSVTVSISGGAQAGLATDDPGRITVGAGPRSVPVKIPAQVSRSGTFTVFAQLHGPGGADWGTAVPLTIDSRAYGALTVVLMTVAGGVLLLMVAWRIVQRVRGGRAAPPPGEEAAT